jgi:hypothetical protein
MAESIVPNNLLPWHNYKRFYLLEEKNVTGNKFVAKCLLCVPTTKMISASKTSSSNLKKHLKVRSMHIVTLLLIIAVGGGASTG